jgi:hypothetical protein
MVLSVLPHGILLNLKATQGPDVVIFVMQKRKLRPRGFSHLCRFLGC